MAITIPTIQTIKAQIIAEIESKIGATVPTFQKAFFRVLATALAGALYLLYRFGRWAYYQIFVKTADDEALLTRGEEYGVIRKAAVNANLTAQATGTNDIIIPAGTLWSGDSNGLVYEQTDAVTIAAGIASLNLECLTAGDAGTLEIYETLTITTPIGGVNEAATVTAIPTAGEDRETIEAYRTRVLNRIKNKPQGGAVADYVLWALEVSGISEAYAFQPLEGFVNVYPLTDEPDPLDRIPDAAKLAEVEAYLQDTRRRPLNANVSALAFTELDFDVDIADLSPNTTAVKTAIEDAIEAYMYARRPLQYSDDPDPVNVVSAAEITKIAIDAGAQVCTIDLKNAGGASITDYELEDDELSALRTLAWV